MFNYGGDQEADEDDIGLDWQYLGRNATVFLIDASEQMFEAEEGADRDEVIPFISALKVRKSLCHLNKVFSLPMSEFIF